MECAGFVANKDKSVWLPELRASWLGFDIDLEHGCISVPEVKLVALRTMLKSTCVATHLPVSFIASLVEKIISMGLALGPM